MEIKKNKNRKLFLFVGLLVFVTLVAGGSYALWQLTFRQSGENTITTSCFDIQFDDGEAITLANAYPISAADGEAQTPYTFTIRNMCGKRASYFVNIETLSEGKALPDQYVALKLTKRPTDDIMFAGNLLNKYRNEIQVIPDATIAYKIDRGVLNANEEITYDLRLWMDEDTPVVDEVMNANYQSKVTITTSYLYTPQDTKNMLRVVSNNDTNGMWAYKENITKVIIQNTMSQIDGAVATADESVLQDGSVRSYVVLNDDGETYTAYLQCDGELFANGDSSYLFSNFAKLETIENIETLNTSNVINMKNMFHSSPKLTSLNIGNWDTRHVENMQAMFYGNSSLTSLDLNSWDTSNVEYMGGLFCRDSSLTNILIDKWNTKNVVDMGSMFYGNTSLTSLDISNWDTSSVVDTSFMFYKASGLGSLDLNNWNTVSLETTQAMFYEASSLTQLNIGNWNTSSIVNMSYMFQSATGITSLDLSNWDTSNVISMRQTFYEMTALNNLNISTWNTSKVVNMGWMFSLDSSLTSLDLSTWDTSSVTMMQSTFAMMSGLTDLNISTWNTSNVTNMAQMFYGSSNLASIDLSGFDTSKVTTMESMFQNTTKLRNVIYGSKFVRANNSDISSMFYNSPANKPTGPTWANAF